VSARQVALKRRRYARFKGLSTGLCGCITSFSSWQLDASKALVYWPSRPDRGDDNKGGAAQAIGWFTIIMVGFAVASAGLRFGKMMATTWWSPLGDDAVVVKPVLRRMDGEDRSVAGLGLLSFAALVPSLVATGHRDLAVACAFAPLGCIGRHKSSGLFGGRPAWGWLPRGTLLVNTLGTILLATLAVLARSASASGLEVDVANGIAMGFCGCLTTISTFTLELDHLASDRPTKALAYAAVSVAASQLALLAINGIYVWGGYG